MTTTSATHQEGLQPVNLKRMFGLEPKLVPTLEVLKQKILELQRKRDEAIKERDHTAKAYETAAVDDTVDSRITSELFYRCDVLKKRIDSIGREIQATELQAINMEIKQAHDGMAQAYKQTQVNFAAHCILRCAVERAKVQLERDHNEVRTQAGTVGKVLRALSGDPDWAQHCDSFAINPVSTEGNAGTAPGIEDLINRTAVEMLAFAKRAAGDLAVPEYRSDLHRFLRTSLAPPGPPTSENASMLLGSVKVRSDGSF